MIEPLRWYAQELFPTGFEHIPLWTVYADWGWGTDDADRSALRATVQHVRGQGRLRPAQALRAPLAHV